MSRQIGSLHRSNSHPANIQTQIPIIPLFAFPPPDSPVINIPSSMNSDTNSDILVFHTISQFNSDVETPDEFADSEPSPSTHTQTNSSVFSKPPIQPIQTNHPLPSLSTPSYASQVTPTYSPFNSDRSHNNSPDNIQIPEKLDNFITTTINTPPHSYDTSTIINSNIIKSTNSYTLFRLHSIFRPIIHIHIHQNFYQH